MPDVSQNDRDGGVLRGTIVILLAGIVIGLAFNSLLRASNGEGRGLAWIRQEVKLARLEELIADTTLTVTDPDASAAVAGPAGIRPSDGESVGETSARSVPSRPEPEPAPVSRPADTPAAAVPPAKAPPTETLPAENPSAVAEPAAGEGPAAESQPLDTIPVIPESMEPLLVQHGTVKALHRSGAAIFVDARSAEEFAAGHIAGAVSLPFDGVYEDPTLIDRLGATDQPLLCYCDGGECELAENLAFVLIDAGYRRVLVYEGGTTAWIAAGEKLVTDGAGGP